MQDNILSSINIQPEPVWRIAVEIRLRKNGFIIVTINGKVSRDFF